MTEKEMIEEMAKDIYEQKSCDTYYKENCKLLAHDLVTLGYRKLPEGSVVLGAEDYSDYLTLQSNYTNAKERCEKLQADNERLYKNLGKFKESVEKETLGKIKLKPIECGEECGYYYLDISVTGKELLQRVYFNSDFIDGKVRKETAKEILKLVKQKSWCYQVDGNGKAWTYSITVTQLKDIAKQFGVEV